ncbi:MAG: polyketide synthase PksJ [Candidatus Eremiobacteraeota bacterium]|nr:polyketide synthase PksJ [Candidatus Eremiobacteraeota bacterium]
MSDRRALLQEALRQRRAAAPPAPGPARGAAHGPLSYGQERLWFLEQFDPGRPVYHVPVVLPLRGELDPERLQAALDGLVRRHDALRTALRVEDGTARQVVLEPAPLELELSDLSGLDPAAREAQAARWAVAAAARPFDFAAGRLVRAALARLGPDEHRLLLVVHHIACDGWSLNVLLDELAAELAPGGREPLPPGADALRYVDFARWQRDSLRGERLEALLAFWRAELGDAPRVLELPADRPRPPVQSFRGALHRFGFTRVRGTAVQERARAAQATPFMVLHAAFAAYVARLTGRDDLLIGTPGANRPLPELERAVGMFVNSLALRTRLRPGSTFAGLLAGVRERTLELFAHQELPLELLVAELVPERDPSRMPLVQVGFSFETTPRQGPFAASGLTEHVVDLGVSKFDLMLTLEAVGDEYRGSVEYATDLFDPATIARFVEGYETLLADALARPDAEVGALELLGPHERALLAAFHATARDFACERLESAIARNAAALPHALALDDGQRRLTYAQLDERAERLAQRLRERGVRPDAIVAILFGRTVDAVVAMLAVFKAGAAYLPLDPAHPPARLAEILADAAAAAVLTSAEHAPLLPAAVPRLLVAADGTDAAGAGADGALAGAAAAARAPLSPRSAAYVLFTSGSTGRPKGVPCTHAAVANLIHNFRRHAPLPPGSAGSCWSSLTFDVSIAELFLLLWEGGTVNLAPETVRLDPRDFVAWMSARGIESGYVAPYMLETLAAELERGGGPRRLKRLKLGVEPIDGSVLRRIKAALPEVRIINCYGPTEATVCVTMYDVPPGLGPGTVSVGPAMDNLRVHVLDEALAPVPLGAAGEVYLAGVGLAHGYLGRPAATASAFVPDPFAPDGGRLYRTGDVGRLHADGTLSLSGRADRQLKLNGVRIEPGEIESALAVQPGVSEAYATVARAGPLAGRIVAYVATGGAAGVEERALLAELAARLPSAYVPARIVVLARFPRLPNLKLDAAALPPPEPVRLVPAAGAAAQPLGPTERALAEVWSTVVGAPPEDAEANFFVAGGTSLAAVQLVSRVREALGADLGVRAVYETPTLGALAARLDALRAQGPAPASVPAIVSRRRGP